MAKPTLGEIFLAMGVSDCKNMEASCRILESELKIDFELHWSFIDGTAQIYYETSRELLPVLVLSLLRKLSEIDNLETRIKQLYIFQNRSIPELLPYLCEIILSNGALVKLVINKDNLSETCMNAAQDKAAFYMGSTALRLACSKSKSYPEMQVSCNACYKMFPKIGYLKCSRCKSVCYCNQECQKADWPNHKSVCKKHN